MLKKRIETTLLMHNNNIKIIDDPIEVWDESLVLKEYEIGEIVVTGPTTTKEYFNRPIDTKLAKIKENDIIWHRMGDLGYFDDEGYFWFCGRKGHRLETKNGMLTTVNCETIFNNHSKVYRSALIGIGKYKEQTPVIIIEPHKNHFPKNKSERKEFVEELLKLGSANELTKNIEIVRFHPNFPTDIRHNAKIFREKLKVWVETGKMTDDRNIIFKISDMAKGIFSKNK
jgi:acyl-CoA synthetase (AMP-forming)/AMP-acid ligase II